MLYKEINQIKYPQLGMGVHHIDDGDFLIKTVENYIKNGFYFIETANCFENEKGVGLAIKNCIDNKIIKREDLFISTKLHDRTYGYTQTKNAIDTSKDLLGTGYIDMFQLRLPYWGHSNWKNLVIDAWRAIEEAYFNGNIKIIGVSNFAIRHLEFLLDKAEIKPMVNQIEIHPRYQQQEIQKFCRENNIIVQSWASLQYGKICYDDDFKILENKYNKTIAQIILNWHIAQEHLTMTRTTKLEHLKEIQSCIDFQLENEDIEYINSFDNTCGPTWPIDGIDKE